MRLAVAITSFACCMYLAGCSDSIVSECDVPGDGSAAVAARFSAIQERVFDVSCALPGCHAGSTPQANLDLSAGASYVGLVGVNSLNYPGEQRVRAGSSGQSVLIFLLRGQRQPSMPPAGALSPAVVDSIARWIDNGAAND